VASFEAIFLGLVQGLTEFLPVSSSGHLVILQTWLGIHEEGMLFEIVLHVATLVSVLIFYRRRVGELVVGVFQRRPDAWRYVGKLALGTLPAVLVVLALGEFLEAQFESAGAAGVGLLLTSAILVSTRRTVETAKLPEPSWAAAWWIGCAQAVAILPGVSRSGSTVAAALALGVRPAAAAEFSFLLGSVAIAGAAVRSFPELARVSVDAGGPLLLGGVAALVAGVGAIWLFVRLLGSHGFYRFAYYTGALGLLTLAILLLR
jgi:undecaprenyl-diphosphatase